MNARVGGALLCFGLAVSSSTAFAADNGVQQEQQRPEFFYLDGYDESIPLRDMPMIPPREGDRRINAVKLLRPPRQVPDNVSDPLLAQGGPGQGAAITIQAATTPGLNFDGIGVGLGGYSPGVAPPDTNGAPGDTQYVQWVNSHLAVFDKSSGALVYGPAAGNTLWQGFGGPCELNNDGDPIAIFDQAAQRWVMTQFSVSGGQFYECVAVSTTSDATGSYRRFAYQFTDFNDYPKMSIWPDGYYISFNMFNAAGTAFLGARACVLDRNQMLTPSGTPGPMQCFQLTSSYGGLLPSDWDGPTAPPAGSPNYFMAFDWAGLNGLNMWKFDVDWVTPSNSTFTGPTKITGASFTEACGGGTCIQQPGTGQNLDSLADRLMYRLAYRNFGSHESLVVTHSVAAGAAASGARWYEVRDPNGSPSVYQQGTYSPDSDARWMGSIAMDGSGNMALGYSVSSNSTRPSIRYTGREASDPLGTMQSENTIITGTGSQTGGLSRWGDYSAMDIDPVDDCTFWFTTEYLKSNGSFNWSTRIASFKFPGCGVAPTPDFDIAVVPSSVNVTQGSSANATVTLTSLNGFNSGVSLSASGLPSGVTAGFVPNPATPPAGGSVNSTLTFTASPSAATGTVSVTITGISGALNHSTSVNLTVNPSGGVAVYDPTYQAPSCSAVGNVCDSGATLLDGRSVLGPEPNYPNTIGSSCGDGSSGTYHVDESNDRLKVFTTSGANFAPGQTVQIDATVWAWSTGSSDRLDLYYAADANSPSWTYITTLTPLSGGANTLSTTYTLPAGASMQAVRARFRYSGSVGSCGVGSYDDHDDLVFAVNVPVGNTAIYDAAYGAPVCASPGSYCESGTLLDGRNVLGPEPNQPNTIYSSCADGASGAYHSDESNDWLKVSTISGNNLAAGELVKVEATVWAWNTGSDDSLDLYYAANAASPVWTYITTLTPSSGGASTLSANYTLPAGSVQAVRARFRYLGSPGSCGTGGYDDHDDLIFVVP